MSADPIVILSAARTPVGRYLGNLSSKRATELGSVAIRAAVERARIDPARVDEAYVGCVLSAGLGQAPARQAVLGAGLPRSVACATVNKVCGSGMQAIRYAFDALANGSADVVVAGGMESMSNGPYLALGARGGYRSGHASFYDHVALDGLEDAYDRGTPMGEFGERCAARYDFTRAAQDAYATESLQWAQHAQRSGALDWEIAPVDIGKRQGAQTISIDEQPQTVDAAKIPTLKPAFRADGTITPANSSPLSDGAAALVLARASVAETLGVQPLATIRAHSAHAQEPEWFTTAPIGALRKLFARTGWQPSDVDVDYYEINEAFAVVPMAVMREFGLPRARVNAHGGACAIGHPIGASGARIVVTLLGVLRERGARRGAASLCIGGGEATALAIELT
ncbi:MULTISPECIES: acetyl-CoA C-acyltransferase [Burkholderia]|uniref:acetyl-CoA C-acyltransferase n=1 Tax=Burkholderia TaxID=32008 RepID=UPI00075E883E|nr:MULTISPECIES: acetyl-CoA C-acyltransferase [Burkholderia]AOJ70953.1 acetyl-CoA acetyltransferase [Burkholderia savannae]KVG42829.1 acetyl-CoA acetyltransferase [Burkholderia sp. MSMB0265]KVG78480.1 acetyl-CoA acetyltransferase [Burkholderia sp. MSMB2040]KVG90934.1 acetyl-CoA acetyltransferase [Burkholderia sp. MSMB2041]KVG91661.1 acetyl-CoA acetyltransferase [Burkholderia sp. MSMB2042]